MVKPEVPSVTLEQKLFLSHLSLAGELLTTPESHQLSPVQSVSTPQAHVTPAASVLRVVPSVMPQAGLGAGVVEVEISASGGGAVFVHTFTVCETPPMLRVSSDVAVTVVVDVHVLWHAPVDQLPQSLLQ